jgi:ribosome-associated protein
VVRNLTDVLAAQRKRDEDDRDLRSRSDARRERKQREAAWVDLGEALVNLSVRQLEQLALPEGLRDAVLEARRITSPAARMRALRLVRRELRDGDEAVIAALTQRLQQITRAKGRVRS